MLRAFLLALPLSALAMAPALAEEKKMDPKVVEAVKDTLKEHDDALNKQDLKGVMALYADSPGIVLMGTGPGEFWMGKEAIADTYEHFFKDFEAGSLSHDCPFKSGSYQGDVAWLIASCQMKDKTKEGPREYVVNVSAVLTNEKGTWKYRTLHFSNLTGGGAEPAK
jgi:ketosteroid isomerase-like protein